MTSKHYYQQAAPAPFRSPEFYDNGLVLRILSEDEGIHIHRNGEAHLVLDDKAYRTPNEFALGFSDGNLPQDGEGVEWQLNAWFELYAEDEMTIVELGEVFHDLSEAIARAEEILAMEDTFQVTSI